MALTIEDGSNVANANSYVTDPEYVEYANLRGLTIGKGAEVRQKELILAMDYIFSREKNMQGTRTTSTQENAYPRTGVYIRSSLLDPDTIPVELKKSQMEAAAAAYEHQLLINSSNNNIQREKLDTLEVEYFSGGSWVNVRLDRVLNYLDILLISFQGRLNRI